MNKPRSDSVQISSDQLDGRLARIEDRISGVEAILAHANRNDIESLIAEAVGKSAHRKNLLRSCETPQSIPSMQKALGLGTDEAVHYHLRPLRDHGLLQHASTAPEVTYEWTPLLRRLNKAVREKLLK